METTGSRIKHLRLQKGFARQVDWAEAIGIDQSRVSDIESKNRRFHADTLLRMAEVLQVSPWYILHGTKTPTGGMADELHNICQQISPAECTVLLKMARSLVNSADGDDTTRNSDHEKAS